MKEQINEDLLIKYLLGEAHPDETVKVEAWAAAHSDNDRKLDEIRNTLATSKRLAKVSPIDETEAWVRFKSKRGPVINQPVELVPEQVRSKWFSIAAAVLLLLGGGITAYIYSSEHGTSADWVTLTAYNQVRVDTLPDGTIVHINKNSTLMYPGHFTTKREVKLTGEAFFNVIHNDAVPFTVQVENVHVQDIGTTFNIKNREHHIEVIVGSGIVKVSKNKATIQLSAQQKVNIKAADKNLQIEQNSDELYNYYMSNTFAANKTPLWRLIEVLNEAYSADIKIENSTLRNTPITASIKLQDSLENILHLIELTTPHMRVEKTGGTYIIK